MVTISFTQGLVSPGTYAERTCLTFLIAVVVELVFILTWKSKIDFKTKNSAKTYLSCVLMGIGVCMFQRIIFILFPQIGMSVYEQMGVEEYRNKFYLHQNLFAIIYIGIIGPIIEEIFYRGRMLNELLKKYKPTYCIVIAAFLFGLSHMNLIQFVSAFIMGLISGVVYIKTKDIKAPIIIHLVNNTYSMITWLLKEAFEAHPDSVFKMASSIALGLVLLLLGFYIFYKENIRGAQDSKTSRNRYI